MKYPKTLVFFLLTFLSIVISCKKAGPADLSISEEKMIAILVDLHIAEAAILSANKAQKDSIGGIYYKQIFDMHEIQDSIFYQNLEIISSNPIRTEAIYEVVIEKIEKLGLEEKKEVGTKKK